MGPFPFKHLLNPDGSLQNIVSEPLRKANKVIAVSPSLCSKMNDFGLPEPIYIPNIINEDFFGISTQKLTGSEFIFFCLGDIIPSKGIKELLFAIHKLSDKKTRKFLVRIGGAGEYLEEYKSLAEELGIDNYVKWMGRLSREEVKREYQSCSAFVLPSHLETFGVVYAEAIACGKPIIGTYSGGPECIINELNGVLVKVGDINDLSSKMAIMMESSNDYSAVEIRKDFEKRFSKKAVIPKILSIYNTILES
jgi:glycosyltransferase involved in cell wall biosynthesis